MRVSEMQESERPAIRLYHNGAGVLSTAELLAVVIGGDLALEKAQAGLAEVGGRLKTLAGRSLADVERMPFGRAKGAIIAASMELGRRMCAEGRDEGKAMRSPRDVAEHCVPRYEDLGVEEFHVLILDAQHRLSRDVLITRGILNSSLVHPREVFREAIAERAAAVILVHNHPSGDPAPSADDRTVTEQLVAAGQVLDIPVHDHVIIGRGRYTSFAEAGLL